MKKTKILQKHWGWWAAKQEWESETSRLQNSYSKTCSCTYKRELFQHGWKKTTWNFCTEKTQSLTLWMCMTEIDCDLMKVNLKYDRAYILLNNLNKCIIFENILKMSIEKLRGYNSQIKALLDNRDLKNPDIKNLIKIQKVHPWVILVNDF